MGHTVQVHNKPKKRSTPLTKPMEEAESATPIVDRNALVPEDFITPPLRKLVKPQLETI
jgi:hypothetical protein